MSKICCIFNLGPLYRWPIYSLMAKELACDFYLGDKTFTPIRTFDYQKLDGFKGYLRFKKKKYFYSLKGALRPILLEIDPVLKYGYCCFGRSLRGRKFACGVMAGILIVQEERLF